MAFLEETSSFDGGVYKIETTDQVIGGESGIANAGIKNLVNRTRWLRNWMAKKAVESFTGSMALETNSVGDLVEVETFGAGRIPNLNASKINAGTFDAARIPNLNASKINAGTFDAARIPQATTGALGGSALASQAEVLAGTDVNKIVTSETLAGKDGGKITAIVTIGDNWNMQTTPSRVFASAIPWNKILSAKAIIVNDDFSNRKRDLTMGGYVDLVQNGSDTNIEMIRTTGGIFDAAEYNDTAIDRGIIIIEYLP